VDGFEQPPCYGAPLFYSFSVGFLLKPWGLSMVLLLGMINHNVVEILDEITFDCGVATVTVTMPNQ
jgi:hypothetical protein